MAGGIISSGRGRGRRGGRPMSDINVTPMVDVMLVLLIVFMVAAPLLTVGVPVDLPESSAETLPQEEKPLTISVDSAGKVFLQEEEVTMADLIPRLRAISGAAQAAPGGEQPRIFVRGDRAINYGTVMQVMGLINAAGFTRVSLVAEAAVNVPAE
ncbi:protein TolR [Zavarzinia sp. CC-PAN008]|uniref:protein TolR n=1 Tax=Zavarzinia sp. CC-PAN008 TaxID=3243332 RepID=UPI003F74AA47